MWRQKIVVWFAPRLNFRTNAEDTIHFFNCVCNDVALIRFWLMIEERNVIRCINTDCPKFGKGPTLCILSTGVKNIVRFPLCAIFNNSTLKCLTGVASLTCTKQ
jgi:hypothetical protein